MADKFIDGQDTPPSASAVGGTPAAGGGIPVGDVEFPDEFKALWQQLEQMSDRQVLDEAERRLEEEPELSREVLTTWLAQRLGYSRVWRRKSSLRREPLWDVLSASGYAQLDEFGERAVATIGEALLAARSFMHPSAALATLAVWRHSSDEQLRHKARRRIERRALPDEPEWLYEVVSVFIDDESIEEAAAGRSLAQLVEMVLDCSYWETAALLAGLLLVHRYGRWYHSAAESNLTHACDVAARQYPHEARRWLDVLAEAARGGQLSHRWLEEPVQAAIRLSIDEPERERKLRQFLRGRPFDADYGRLEELYQPQLKLLRNTGGAAVRRRLFEEVEATVGHHPTRAQRLLELVAIHQYGPRLGARFYRLRRALEQLAEHDDDKLCAWLVGLYVHTATLESHAARLVRLAGDSVDWNNNPFADQHDYETYLIISDYDRAFDELTCKFDGVTMEHADKYAAARIKFFVRKRVDPSRIHRLVQAVFRPVEWLGSGLTELGLVNDVIDRGMERFEHKIRTQDRRQEVVEEYKDAGVPIRQFDEIPSLPAGRIDSVVSQLCNRRLLLGAVAGGVSGGLAPYSWGALSMADIPVLLGVTADVCSRFCWYYGFDPRNCPEIPFEILAVALGGTRPEAIEPMLVRQSLHSHVVRKSIVVGALAHGGVAHLTGKGLSRLIQRRVEKSTVQRAGELARRAVSRNLHRRAETTKKRRGMPLVGAALGAVLNTMLLYDVCEAAQAVLTDRFLERKYPEWVRHIERIESTTDRRDS